MGSSHFEGRHIHIAIEIHRLWPLKKKKKKKKAFIEVRRYEPRNVGRADDFRIFKIICISQDYELYVFRPTPGTGPPRAPRQAAPPPGNDSVHRWAISCPPRKEKICVLPAGPCPPPPPEDDPPPPPADGPPAQKKKGQVLPLWKPLPQWGLLGGVLGLRPPPSAGQLPPTPPPRADDPPAPPVDDPPPKKTSQVLGVWESFPHWGLLGRVLGLAAIGRAAAAHRAAPPTPPHLPAGTVLSYGNHFHYYQY
ncbi:hypothetical protein DTO045G8_8890 [Paecilomyces variotii]|nr:hypothetical protein DTO045G8_8890 [Paecilomyces variotii]